MSQGKQNLEEIGKPDLVVIGSSQVLDPQLGQAYDRLLVSTVSWFRGRPELLQAVQPKTREQYTVAMKPETAINLGQYSLIGILILVTTLGFGVLSARRRG